MIEEEKAGVTRARIRKDSFFTDCSYASARIFAGKIESYEWRQPKQSLRCVNDRSRLLLRNLVVCLAFDLILYFTSGSAVSSLQGWSIRGDRGDTNED